MDGAETYDLRPRLGPLRETEAQRRLHQGRGGRCAACGETDAVEELKMSNNRKQSGSRDTRLHTNREREETDSVSSFVIGAESGRRAKTRRRQGETPTRSDALANIRAAEGVPDLCLHPPHPFLTPNTHSPSHTDTHTVWNSSLHPSLHPPPLSQKPAD